MCFSLRKAEEWMIRSRSRWKGERNVDMLSGFCRPRLSPGWQAKGANISLPVLVTCFAPSYMGA
ncbi:hypothetical protein RSP03_25300 [Cereibacter sphaeroides]|nr:hypothetical protein RSP03_25300 [Cereibacter sphaeroides]